MQKPQYRQVGEIRHWLNAHNSTKNYEKNDQPSKTIPDQTMSVAEIMRRHVRGIPIEAGKVPLYEEENTMPDLSKMDLVDRQEYLDNAKDELDQLKRKMNQKAKKDTGGKTTKDDQGQKPDPQYPKKNRSPGGGGGAIEDIPHEPVE